MKRRASDGQVGKPKKKANTGYSSDSPLVIEDSSDEENRVNLVSPIKKGLKAPEQTVLKKSAQAKKFVFGALVWTKYGDGVISAVKRMNNINWYKVDLGYGWVHLHYDQLRDVPYEAILNYPPRSLRNTVTVTRADLVRCRPNVLCNDNLIEFYFRYLKETRIPADSKGRFFFFSPLFYSMAVKLLGGKSSQIGTQAWKKMERWLKHVDIFQTDYVFIPINDNFHWSLAVVCNLPVLVDSQINQADLWKKEAMAEVEDHTQSITTSEIQYDLQTKIDSPLQSGDRAGYGSSGLQDDTAEMVSLQAESAPTLRLVQNSSCLQSSTLKTTEIELQPTAMGVDEDLNRPFEAVHLWQPTVVEVDEHQSQGELYPTSIETVHRQQPTVVEADENHNYIDFDPTLAETVHREQSTVVEAEEYQINANFDPPIFQTLHQQQLNVVKLNEHCSGAEHQLANSVHSFTVPNLLSNSVTQNQNIMFGPTKSVDIFPPQKPNKIYCERISSTLNKYQCRNTIPEPNFREALAEEYISILNMDNNCQQKMCSDLPMGNEFQNNFQQLCFPDSHQIGGQPFQVDFNLVPDSEMCEEVEPAPEYTMDSVRSAALDVLPGHTLDFPSPVSNTLDSDFGLAPSSALRKNKRKGTKPHQHAGIQMEVPLIGKQANSPSTQPHRQPPASSNNTFEAVTCAQFSRDTSETESPKSTELVGGGRIPDLFNEENQIPQEILNAVADTSRIMRSSLSPGPICVSVETAACDFDELKSEPPRGVVSPEPIQHLSLTLQLTKEEATAAGVPTLVRNCLEVHQSLKGILVKNVPRNAPQDIQRHLQPGDLIVKVNGRLGLTCSSLEDLLEKDLIPSLFLHSQSRQATVVVFRGIFQSIDREELTADQIQATMRMQVEVLDEGRDGRKHPPSQKNASSQQVLSSDQPDSAFNGTIKNENEDLSSVPIFGPDDPHPCIILLDSAKGHEPKNVYSTIRRLCAAVWKQSNSGRGHVSFAAKCIPGFSPVNIPRQTNHLDCGFFVMQYAESFIKNPPTVNGQFVSSKGSKTKNTEVGARMISKWFDPMVMKTKRYEVMKLVVQLQQEQACLQQKNGNVKMISRRKS